MDTTGSEVVGLRIGSQPSPNPNSIPELLLSAKLHFGVGTFDGVTFIQRLDTFGGLAPTTLPTGLGQEFRSHYTANYRFSNATPEPGPVGFLVGVGISGAAFLVRHKRRTRVS
jgi:hypothetical protein